MNKEVKNIGIGILVNAIFYEACSWYEDEGNYQPTYEQAISESVELVKQFLAGELDKEKIND